MTPELNKKYLITTDGWFVAPDGEQYKSVFGTVTAILDDESSLGIKTNRNSSNWYVVIGNMMVAGCQIHYCVRTDKCSSENASRLIEHNGGLYERVENTPRAYFADDQQ